MRVTPTFQTTQKITHSASETLQWYLIQILPTHHTIIHHFSIRQLQYPNSTDEVSQRCRSLDGLQIALRTQPHSFVSRFLEVDGLNCLLNLLAGMDWDTAQSNIHTAALGCVKALMNNSVTHTLSLTNELPVAFRRGEPICLHILPGSIP